MKQNCSNESNLIRKIVFESLKENPTLYVTKSQMLASEMTCDNEDEPLTEWETDKCNETGQSCDESDTSDFEYCYLGQLQVPSTSKFAASNHALYQAQIVGNTNNKMCSIEANPPPGVLWTRRQVPPVSGVLSKLKSIDGKTSAGSSGVAAKIIKFRKEKILREKLIEQKQEERQELFNLELSQSFRNMSMDNCKFIYFLFEFNIL